MTMDSTTTTTTAVHGIAALEERLRQRGEKVEAQIGVLGKGNDQAVDRLNTVEINAQMNKQTMQELQGATTAIMAEISQIKVAVAAAATAGVAAACACAEIEQT